MDGISVAGFVVCAGGDLVTELVRSRLVGLWQKGFTPAATRQSSADPQSARREKDSLRSVFFVTVGLFE